MVGTPPQHTSCPVLPSDTASPVTGDGRQRETDRERETENHKPTKTRGKSGEGRRETMLKVENATLLLPSPTTKGSLPETPTVPHNATPSSALYPHDVLFSVLMSDHVGRTRTPVFTRERSPRAPREPRAHKSALRRCTSRHYY